MKRCHICIVLFWVSLCGVAQTVEDSIKTKQDIDEFEKYTHLAKDSLIVQNIVEYQKFCYSGRRFIIEKGDKGECESGHRLLMWSLSSVLSQNKIFIRNPQTDYCLTNLYVYTNTKLFFDNIIDVYVLSSFSSTNKSLMRFVCSLKNKSYIAFDPIMEMSHICYIFWYKEKLIITFVPNRIIFAKDVNDKIVEVAKEALECYYNQIKPDIGDENTKFFLNY
ncbi:MAG: hypothetical protein ACFNUH_01220 [Bacteroidota bacterium]